MRFARRALTVARIAAAAVALARIARAAHRRRPLTVADAPVGPRTQPAATTRTTAGAQVVAGDGPTISVIVPARDEAERIGPLLAAVCGAPGVHEVVVVDDQSTDATSRIAAAAGATVVTGDPLPDGWAGKAWALQQGLRSATGDWVVMLDADTCPSPALPGALVARAIADDLDLVSVGGRFECPTAGARWLHPAMLTTLVYRFGPAGAAGAAPPDRQLANGQCMAAPRERLLAAGGMTPVAGHVVEDVALARHLAGAGWKVAMLDGPELLTTRMFDDLAHTARGWARSLALPGVEPRWRQVAELGVVLLAQALPIPRLFARRGDLLDVGLAMVRLGTLAGTAQAYERRGPAYWLSPTADLPATAALAWGTVARTNHWRGRTYRT